MLVTQGGEGPEKGQELAQSRYYPFGGERWSSAALPTDKTFTGQRSEGFGLLDYNARYYDVQLGRFVNPDTIVPDPGSPLAWDRYGYGYNNPINNNDPTGHWVTSVVGALLGGIAGFAIYSFVAGDNFDAGEAFVAASTFAVAGALIGTGVGAAAGIGMAVNSSLAIAAGGVGAGVAGGAYGYMATTAATGGDFDTTSFAVSSVGGAVDAGLSLTIPSPQGQMLASGLSSAAQSGVDAALHGESYSSDDFLGDFSGGVFANLAGQSMGVTPRGMQSLPNLAQGDPGFGQFLARQELFIGGYESIRSGLLSSDTMKWGWEKFSKFVTSVGDKLIAQ